MGLLFPRIMRAEKRIRLILSYLALVLLPPFLILAATASKFRGLNSETAADHAQLAQHVAAGEGYTTSYVRPMSLAFKKEVRNHPDLYNAPGHSAVLALFFRWFGASDNVAKVAGGLFWLVSVWLTYLVARRWFSWGVATLATFFYACSVAALAGAIDGLGYSLSAICVLLAARFAFPSMRYEGESRRELHWLAIVLAGMACAAGVLVSYLLVIFAVVLCVYMIATRRRSLRTFILFAAGFLVVATPWLVRNYQLTGSPIFSLYWYTAMENTHTHPGETIWRTVTVPQNPVVFMAWHPGEMLRKIVVNLAMYRSSLPNIFDPVIGFLLLAALLSGAISNRWRGLLTSVVVSLVLTLLASCALRPEPGILVSWTPLLCISGAAFASAWIQDRFGRSASEDLKINLPSFTWLSRGQKHRRLYLRLPNAGKWIRAAAYVVLVVLVAFPLVLFMAAFRGGDYDRMVEHAQTVQALLPKEDTTVMTDQPAFVAWYVKRRAILLFQREESLSIVDDIPDPFAVYITPAIAEIPAKERGEWWHWIVSARGNFRGLTPAEQMPPGTVVRLRTSNPKTEKLPEEVRQALAELEGDPTSAELLTKLGEAYLRADRLRDADRAFRKAVEIDPQNAEAVLGLGRTESRLRDYVNMLGMAETVLNLNPDNPVTLRLFEEAEFAFKQALMLRPRDPWLLINAGLCQAKLKRWGEAEKFFLRASAAAPRAISPRLLLGSLYIQQGLFDQAADELERLLKEQPRNASVREALGRVRIAQGRLQEALEEFTAAVHLKPEWVVPYVKAGYVYSQLKDYEHAVEFYEQALKLSPNSTTIRFYLAEALALQGQTRRAIEVYEKLLADNPSHPMVLNNLAYWYAESSQNMERALDYARRAVQTIPQSGIIRDTLGWVYYRCGLYYEAVRHFEEAIRLSPDNGQIHYHLAKALAALGRRADAISAFKRALTLGLPPDEKAEAEHYIQTP